MPASEFDDHANVVVLETVVRRLIILQSRNSPDPETALQDWESFFKQQHQLYVDFAFKHPNATPEMSLNAVTAAGQFETFSEDLRREFDDGSLD